MERILLLEDDAALGRGSSERTVERAETLAQAQSCLAQTRYDLLILDINLPDGSGLDLLRTLRVGGDRTPVVMLTANDLEIDELTGLEAGADDYITKPFSLAVLRARVDAQLRRRADRTDDTTQTIGLFRFDFTRMEFRRAGEAVELSKAEQRLLRVLVENRGHAVSRAALLWYRRRTARTIARLDQMLTAAMDDRFSEADYDERRLSALESRMARYLAASSLSARQVQAQKNQLSVWISDISHQTKTPLANVMLYTQLLAEQPLPEQGQKCVHEIAAQADKLQALIQALVKTSRLENGILALHPQPGDIAPVVERAAAQYVPRAAAKGLTMTVGAIEGTAVFDAKWTEEALCNLLDNAVKYTPSGGAVQVEVRSYELFAAVRVTDTGLGIPEGEQAQVFGRFHRAPEVYQKDGVGIGLYLTRQIATLQGGYVRLQSAPGKGSTFSLYLPRKTGQM